MARFVLTIKEDVCKANGKDVKAVELLKVMAHYGTVETFETVVASEIAPLQQTIDNLVRQIEAIDEKNVTDVEMGILKAFRLAVDGIVAQHVAVENECRKTIETLQGTLTQFKNKIIAVVGE
jgi:hypothetical protein